MAKFMAWLGWGIILAAGGTAYLYVHRTDPIQQIAGRELTGEVEAAPVSDWSFSQGENLIAVETRPGNPHSVTTVFAVHEGNFYVPAQNASTKSWTHYAIADPRVRIKIKDKIYPVLASRVTDPAELQAAGAAIRAKYNFGSGSGPAPTDVWIFRMDPRQASTARAASALATSPPATGAAATGDEAPAGASEPLETEASEPTNAAEGAAEAEESGR